MRIGRWIRYLLPRLWEKTPELGYINKFAWGNARRTPHSIVEIPKIIWIYWNTFPISSVSISICVEQIKRLNPDYEIHIVYQHTLRKYLPHFPEAAFRHSPTIASDLIRLMLLEKNGGIYIDASTLVSESLDWVRNQQQTDGTEAVFYYTDENTVDTMYPMIENSFIAAIAGSPFIQALRQELEKCLASLSPEDYLKTLHDIPAFKFPLELNYYRAYLIAQVVMRREQDFRLSLLRGEDDLLLYSLCIRKKWGEMAMAEILLLNKTPNPKPKIVKIIRYARRRLDFFINNKMYRKGSWMGDLILEEKTR